MLHATESISLLLCTLGQEPYALPMQAVREVLRWRQPTAIPGTPPTILGVIHHRGAVLPIVDLRRLLGIAAAPPTRKTRLIVVEHNEISAGLVSDGVADLIVADPAAIEPPASVQDNHLQGLLLHNDQPIGVLDLQALFATLTGDER